MKTATLRAVLLGVVALGIAITLAGAYRAKKALKGPGRSVASVSDTSRYVAIEFPTGFVLDRETKLVWNRCPLGTTMGQDAAGPLCTGNAEWLNYKFAEATAKHFASYGDAWRLPTIDELRTLPTTDRCCHTLDPIVFPIFQEPPDRPIPEALLKRYTFHSTNVDEQRRLSWRLDTASGKALEVALREEAFVRLVRNATEEELRTLARAQPIDQSGRALANTRLTPPARERSEAFLAARAEAVRGGEIKGHGCNAAYPLGDGLKGCLDGVKANLFTRLREGGLWADTHRPAKSYECTFEDPIANVGCREHFRKYLGDVFPNLPETTTTAECAREAEAEYTANLKYDEATGANVLYKKRRLMMEGAMQNCSIYDATHARGEKVTGRAGYVGGPSPY